jgi:16S rRNA (uracil1498-N3)-methyltransferase
MRANYKMQRLFVEADLGEEARILLATDQAHYVANVLRMREGGEILLFNGRDGEWRGRIEAVAKKKVELALVEQTRPQTPPSDLLYCFAPLKKGRLDYLVQKAVEMGAGRLLPVITQHTQVPKLGIDRLQANVIEAAEQCGILSVPHVEEPVKLEKMLENWDENRQLIFCDEAAPDNNPITALERLKGGKTALLVGPEGGFSESERKMLYAADYVTAIPLGPRILRADTAAVAALALVQAVIGDWNS